MTFVIQGALLSLIGGANHGAFLSLNLIYFIALQVCLFVTVRSRTNNVALAWVAIAILLSASTHFFFAGDLYDYRIDYSALCLYGIWCCFLLSSHAFRNRDATIGVAIAGVLLVLERFFTVLYIGTVLGKGGLGATALLAAAGDGRQFNKARDMAAWLGLAAKGIVTKRSLPPKRPSRRVLAIVASPAPDAEMPTAPGNELGNSYRVHLIAPFPSLIHSSHVPRLL
jgi:hypothetical protein